jgi:ferritin-like metal-binding protein YciE
MEGVLQEGAEMIEEEADDEVRDAGLIAAAQRVEHYEMAGLWVRSNQCPIAW